MTINLDHNATTPLWPEVAQAMHALAVSGLHNPASQHALGRQARRMLEETRERVGELLGAAVYTPRADHVLFTSGGTEANNLAVFGLAHAAVAVGAPRRVIVSPLEHPCVAGAAGALERRGWQVERLKASRSGRVDPADLAARLTQPAALVSVMLANHETGAIQPVRELAELAARRHVAFHTDAVQAAGKLPVRIDELGVSALSVSAHKFNGPTGVGALVLRQGVPFEPMLFGGFQQGGLRPGTESVPLAVGLCTALDLWEARRTELTAALAERTARFEFRLANTARAAGVELVVHAFDAPRTPQTSSLAFPGVDRQQLLVALDLEGIACSTGSACESGSSEPSPVLLAMGLPEALVASSLRFSCGPETSLAEIDSAAERIIACCVRLRGKTPA